MPVITLTTDFGLTDTYVGLMKGVIHRICTAAGLAIVDITHGIPPQDVTAGALALQSALDYFPEGTIHLAVVDPGVGTQRRPVAIRTESATFVGPDNGLFSLALQQLGPLQAVQLTEPRFHLPRISATFHGRDIFAPVAAHLANGVPLTRLGPGVNDLIPLDIPQPQLHHAQLHGQVLYIDHFGNCITSITRRSVENLLSPAPQTTLEVLAGRHEDNPIPLAQTFGDVEPGQIVACFGSTDRLEIARRNARADVFLHLETGDPVVLRSR